MSMHHVPLYPQSQLPALTFRSHCHSQAHGRVAVELAQRLGNTQTFVSKCERGERRIDAVELVEFAEALGVPPLEVLAEYLERRDSNLFATSKKTRSRS